MYDNGWRVTVLWVLMFALAGFLVAWLASYSDGPAVDREGSRDTTIIVIPPPPPETVKVVTAPGSPEVEEPDTWAIRRKSLDSIYGAIIFEWEDELYSGFSHEVWYPDGVSEGE